MQENELVTAVSGSTVFTSVASGFIVACVSQALAPTDLFIDTGSAAELISRQRSEGDSED